MWAYIYRSEIFDLDVKLSSSTGLSPSFIKSAWIPEVAIIFESQLGINDKSQLDDFMETRKLSYHRVDEYQSQSTGSSGAPFEAKYILEQYTTAGKLSAIKEYASKTGSIYTGLRKETLYEYSALGALLKETVNIYNGSGSIEDSKVSEYSTDRTLTSTTVKKEGT